MPVRRRNPAVVVQFRPAMPAELCSYFHVEWGAPPDDGRTYGPEWEEAHRSAYQRWLQAQRDWLDQHRHMPVDPASAPVGDVPWCGEFDEHDCGGVECRRRPAQQPRVERDDEW